MTQKQREDVAMYLMSRADAYVTDSPCWVALSDAAHNVINGDVEAHHDYNGEDADMRRRVRKWVGTAPRSVDPIAGVEVSEKGRLP